jgi:hypothetical protein
MIDPSYTFAPLTMDDVPDAAALQMKMTRFYKDPAREAPTHHRSISDDYVDDLNSSAPLLQHYRLLDPRKIICGVVSYSLTEGNTLKIEEINVRKRDITAQDQLIQHFIEHGKETGARRVLHEFMSKKYSGDNDWSTTAYELNILERNGFTNRQKAGTSTYYYG